MTVYMSRGTYLLLVFSCMFVGVLAGIAIAELWL